MIVVNARFLTQKLTGVQRFAFEMSCQLMELYHDDILFVAPRNIRRSRYSDQLKPVLIGKYTGYLWEQYELPRYLKKRGCPLLLNLCNLAPVVYRNKISTIHDITFVKYPADYPFRMRWMYKMLVPHILNTSIRIITVSTTVLSIVPFASPKNDTNRSVAKAEAAILTMLFPTRMAERALS